MKHLHRNKQLRDATLSPKCAPNATPSQASWSATHLRRGKQIRGAAAAAGDVDAHAQLRCLASRHCALCSNAGNRFTLLSRSVRDEGMKGTLASSLSCGRGCGAT